MKRHTRALAIAFSFAVLAFAIPSAQAWTPPNPWDADPTGYDASGAVQYEVETHVFGIETGPGFINCSANGSVDFYSDSWGATNNHVGIPGLTTGGVCSTSNCTVNVVTSGSPWTAEGFSGSQTIVFTFGPNLQFNFVNAGGGPYGNLTFTANQNANTCTAGYNDSTGVLSLVEVNANACMTTTGSNNTAVVPNGRPLSINAPSVTLTHPFSLYGPAQYD
jgi:hypothetical protein